MIGKMKSFITNLLVEGNIIREEQRELYEYCVEGLIETAGNILLTLFLGVALGKVTDTLVFLVLFVSLRSTCGGYHVKNENLCFFLSIALFLAVILSAGYLGRYFDLMCSAKQFLISILLILLLAPVSCAHKKLDRKKRSRLKSYIWSELIVVSIIYSVLLIAGNSRYSFMISNTMLLVSMLLSIQYLENMREKHRRLGA